MQQDLNSAQPAPSITWLNMSGDVTITWEKEDEAAILALIEKKMSQGYSFFIAKPRFFGLLGVRKVPVQSLEDARAAGHVVADDSAVGRAVSRICDPEVTEALRASKAQLLASGKPTGALETIRRAASASEVLRHQTVAVRPVIGG